MDLGIEQWGRFDSPSYNLHLDERDIASIFSIEQDSALFYDDSYENSRNFFHRIDDSIRVNEPLPNWKVPHCLKQFVFMED